MKKTSVPIAKERLEALVVSDRIHCKPEEYEMICKELYKTLSKYMAVAEDEMRIHITRSEIHIQLMGGTTLRRIKFRKPYKLKNYRFGLVALVLVLSIIGILVVGSANESYQSKQIFGVVIGLVVMAIVSLIDYVWITNFYWILYGMSVFMLAIVLIPGIGVYVNGARRWINLGFTNFQPSELAKILLIIFFAKIYYET